MNTNFKLSVKWYYRKQQYLPSGVSTWLILTAVTESMASSTVEQGLIKSGIFPSAGIDKSHWPHIMTC